MFHGLFSWLETVGKTVDALTYIHNSSDLKPDVILQATEPG